MVKARPFQKYLSFGSFNMLRTHGDALGILNHRLVSWVSILLYPYQNSYAHQMAQFSSFIIVLYRVYVLYFFFCLNHFWCFSFRYAPGKGNEQCETTRQKVFIFHLIFKIWVWLFDHHHTFWTYRVWNHPFGVALVYTNYYQFIFYTGLGHALDINSVNFSPFNAAFFSSLDE